MSDDEYDSPEALHGTGNPGSSSGRHNTPNHRKGPRFSWTSAYEATFFRSLCESVKVGLKDNHSFKPEAWDRACTALAERHNAYPNKGHLINKSDNARKKFRLWRGLREDPEFLYNPNTKTVTASEEAWRTHIEVSGIFFHRFVYDIIYGAVGITHRACGVEKSSRDYAHLDHAENPSSVSFAQLRLTLGLAWLGAAIMEHGFSSGS